ncbi:recombinase family protein [Vibrio harveyi]|uniref:recombinase family protein n=1 Tax=Vibrio harveyi TaxID=669 RepID=UPI00165DFBCD|nr:recombinase family protein [Vibrio harveyi]
MRQTTNSLDLSTTKAYSYIRFSTTRQKKGDSLRRQTELAERYAIQQGLCLQDLSFEDLGVSAYRGSNSIEGALSCFIAAVRDGEIDRGSWLLVESVDRLSRQATEDALSLFTTIINLGITLVTLQDCEVYRKGELSMSKLMLLLVKAQAAFEESDKKGKRSKANWDTKRAKMRAGKKFKVATTPQWLTWDKAKERYEIKQEAAATLQRLFNLTIDGYGARAIASTFNDEAIPMLNGAPAKWLASTVNRLQNDKKVIGIYQPKSRGLDGSRTPIGAPVENFYPSVIDKQDFYEAMRIRESKRRGESGSYRRGSMRNLFTGLLRCGLCGNPLHVVQQNNKARVERYGVQYRLVCSTKKELGCASASIKYLTFERMVSSALAYIPELMAGQLDNTSVLKSLDKQLGAANAELKDLTIQGKRVLDMLLTRQESEVLTQRFDSIEQSKLNLQDRIAELQTSKLEASSVEGFFKQAQVMFNEVNSEQAITSVDWRQRFNTQLKRILSKLVVYMSKEGVSVWAVDKSDNTVLSLVGGRRMRLMAGESDMKGNHYGRLVDGDSSIEGDEEGILVYLRNRKEDHNVERVANSTELHANEDMCVEYFDWFESQSLSFVKGTRQAAPTIQDYFYWQRENFIRWGETDEYICRWEDNMVKALAYCGVAWLK